MDETMNSDSPVIIEPVAQTKKSFSLYSIISVVIVVIAVLLIGSLISGLTHLLGSLGIK